MHHSSGSDEQMFGANQQIQHAGGSVKEAEKPSRQCDASSCASQFCQRQEVIMRVKFEATDATGKVHKRGSRSRVYSHCVVIHFAAHPPNKSWPTGVAARTGITLLRSVTPTEIVVTSRAWSAITMRSLRRARGLWSRRVADLVRPIMSKRALSARHRRVGSRRSDDDKPRACAQENPK